MVAGRLARDGVEASMEWLIEDGTARRRGAHGPRVGRVGVPPAARVDRPLLGDLRRFRGQDSKDELYEEAQRRSIALAPVYDLSEVLTDQQLAGDGLLPARSSTRRPGRRMVLPAPPVPVR